MPNFNKSTQERVDAYEGKQEDRNLQCFKEQFNNITMRGKGWYEQYLSQDQMNQWKNSTYRKLDRYTNQEVISNKYLSQLTDWYSPTLKCFFDYKSDFSYLKQHSLINYCEMTKMFNNIGHTSYFLWYELEKRKLQWYVINACNLWDDINTDENWDYHWNPPTIGKNGGGEWLSNWMHITNNNAISDGLIRLIERHKTKFEDEFIKL